LPIFDLVISVHCSVLLCGIVRLLILPTALESFFCLQPEGDRRLLRESLGFIFCAARALRRSGIFDLIFLLLRFSCLPSVFVFQLSSLVWCRSVLSFWLAVLPRDFPVGSRCLAKFPAGIFIPAHARGIPRLQTEARPVFPREAFWCRHRLSRRHFSLLIHQERSAFVLVASGFWFVSVFAAVQIFLPSRKI
jgi:hypothetical protein